MSQIWPSTIEENLNKKSEKGVQRIRPTIGSEKHWKNLERLRIPTRGRNNSGIFSSQQFKRRMTEEHAQDHLRSQHLMSKKVKARGNMLLRDLDQVEVTTEKVKGIIAKITELNSQERP